MIGGHESNAGQLRQTADAQARDILYN